MSDKVLTDRSSIEFSKQIVKVAGIFAIVQISASMALVCIFPHSADPLLSIVMTCTAGYMTIFSWYFGKAYGENKLKITQTIPSYHSVVASTVSTSKYVPPTSDEYDTANGTSSGLESNG